MKRPGGFDRTPEEPREEPREPRRSGREPQPPRGQATSPSETGKGEAPGAQVPQETEAESPVSEAAPAERFFERAEGRADVPGALEEHSGGVLARLGAAVSQRDDPVRSAERRVRAAERESKRRRRRETRRFTASARQARRRALIAGAAVLSLVLFVLIGAFTPLMSVREVRVEGADTVSAAEVERALEKFSGVPLALVDENEVLHALEAFPLIQRFAVERVPPHTLLVRIEERSGAIAIESDGEYAVYDAAGVLVGSSAERPEGMPVGEAGVRTTSSKAFAAAAQVVRDLPAELRARIVSASAQTGQDVLFVLDSGVEVFWGNAEETQRKAVVLQTMLTALGERPVSHIDVSSTEAPVFR